ncbi:hypothetical protein H6P81_003558 [Aristolochia fimbriata]|uniref:tRNA dimethylallyltransferase 2 n=1 Tax=Aristolochia fimbriata TaxID=158543 RepID=A0AAV7FCX3_ARIFI|nr:hypothetical protein H6P81_003558 [Aristolochia fimbriata]
MEAGEGLINSNPRKPKVVVVMGATGSGKSRLAINLSSFFPAEIINADSMQVYEGLEVLTNKVLVEDRKGVPHHLLGTISANVDFTSKDFRDMAIPIIEDTLARNCLPIIVGGTNYYIQALVSPFLLDESIQDIEDCLPDGPLDDLPQDNLDEFPDDIDSSYDRLKTLDPVAANRIHPNDHRKVSQYLKLYANSGVLPSTLFQERASKKWGLADNLRYDCCFIWVDASLSVLDNFVDQRVDIMVGSGLLGEVYDIYKPNADYTRGLRQAIGVREFENFLRSYFSNSESCNVCNCDESGCKTGPSLSPYTNVRDELLKVKLRTILSPGETNLKVLLTEAIDKMKLNTRRLVRRQRRRLNRLRTFFGWDIHYVDATEAFLCKTGDAVWMKQVVEPCVAIIKSFIDDNSSTAKPEHGEMSVPRDLWTRYVCEACGNRILRGSHEWEQHKKGRGHRKRIQSLKKTMSQMRVCEERSSDTSGEKWMCCAVRIPMVLLTWHSMSGGGDGVPVSRAGSHGLVDSQSESISPLDLPS